MKVWIYSLVFAVSSLTVSSQTCPSDHFSAVFVATADQVLDATIPIVPDPDLTFFKNVGIETSVVQLKMHFFSSMKPMVLTFPLHYHQMTNTSSFLRMQNYAHISSRVYCYFKQLDSHWKHSLILLHNE